MDMEKDFVSEAGSNVLPEQEEEKEKRETSTRLDQSSDPNPYNGVRALG